MAHGTPSSPCAAQLHRLGRNANRQIPAQQTAALRWQERAGRPRQTLLAHSLSASVWHTLMPTDSSRQASWYVAGHGQDGWRRGRGGEEKSMKVATGAHASAALPAPPAAPCAAAAAWLRLQGTRYEPGRRCGASQTTVRGVGASVPFREPRQRQRRRRRLHPRRHRLQLLRRLLRRRWHFRARLRRLRSRPRVRRRHRRRRS